MASVKTLPPTPAHASAHSTTPAYHLYPAPPPTVNALSPKQRAQLRRSTTKLSKVLGTTPHLVDAYTGPAPAAPAPHAHTSSHYISDSETENGMAHLPRPDRPRRLTHKRAASERTHPDSYPLSSSSAAHHHRPPRAGHAPSHRSSAPAAPQPVRRLSVEACVPQGDASGKRPPTLTVYKAPAPGMSRSASVAGADRTRVNTPSTSASTPSANSGPAAPRDSLYDSLYEPAFKIPSLSAQRRAKLARVERRLGEGVPLELVFPGEAWALERDELEEEDEEGEDEAAEKLIGKAEAEKRETVTWADQGGYGNIERERGALFVDVTPAPAPSTLHRSASATPVASATASKHRRRASDLLPIPRAPTPSIIPAALHPHPHAPAREDARRRKRESAPPLSLNPTLAATAPPASVPSTPVTASPAGGLARRLRFSRAGKAASAASTASAGSAVSAASAYSATAFSSGASEASSSASDSASPTTPTSASPASSAHGHTLPHVDEPASPYAPLHTYARAADSSRREFAVYVPARHARRRGSNAALRSSYVKDGEARDGEGWSVVRGFGALRM